MLILTLLTLIVTSIFNYKAYKLSSKQYTQSERHYNEQLSTSKKQFEKQLSISKEQFEEQLSITKRQYDEQLSITKEQFDKQQRSIRIQQFETTLFNMIELQQEITEGLELGSIKGRAVFDIFYKYANLDSNLPEFCYKVSCKEIINYKGIEGYESIEQLHLFDHYFRHLYNIFKFIDDADFLDDGSQYIDERYRYARIVRATLSPYELVMLFYNCLSEVGNEKFKGYIEKYSVLNNLRHDLTAISKQMSSEATKKDGTGIYDYHRYQKKDGDSATDNIYYKLSAFEKDETMFRNKEGQSSNGV